MSTNLVPVFNDHFGEFVSDIQSVFPNDPDLLTAKNSLIVIRKANPKLLVKIWIKYVVTPYKDKIDIGDINFFINKDYSDDLVKNDNSDKIMESIDRLRNPIKQMSVANQAKTMKYIQNLSKLALMIPQWTNNNYEFNIYIKKDLKRQIIIYIKKGLKEANNNILKKDLKRQLIYILKKDLKRQLIYIKKGLKEAINI